MLAENYEALFGQIAKASCAKSQAKATVWMGGSAQFTVI
jgi:hypothetical protein